MELRGCSGCSGFSYTEKYKKAIIDFYDWVESNADLGIVKYSEIQRLIEEDGGSDDSEIRMIVPFLVKIGIIDRASCSWHGSRIHKLKLNNLFTYTGVCFIQFLKIQIFRDVFKDNKIKKIIEEMYECFSKIQFYNLFFSDENIYREIVNFLLKYENMDENEFFILCTILDNNQFGSIQDLIQKYREGEFTNSDLQIVYNVNAFSYTKKLLIQYNLFIYDNNGRLYINSKHNDFFRYLIDLDTNGE